MRFVVEIPMIFLVYVLGWLSSFQGPFGSSSSRRVSKGARTKGLRIYRFSHPGFFTEICSKYCTKIFEDLSCFVSWERDGVGPQASLLSHAQLSRNYLGFKGHEPAKYVHHKPRPILSEKSPAPIKTRLALPPPPLLPHHPTEKR